MSYTKDRSPGTRVFARLASLVLLIASLPATAAHDAPAEASSSAVTLAPVVVSGVVPGPALWKVSRGDHVLWILGTSSPLPRDIQWKDDEVTRIIASSQAVLKPPGLQIGAREGFFGKLFLLPWMIGLKKNPDGKVLRDVLPAELYARWRTQKTRYIGRSHGTERLRPLFAGEKLYDRALDAAGLTDAGEVQDSVYLVADQHDIPTPETAYVLVLEHPRDAIRTFKTSSMDDVACLRAIIDATSQDLASARARANAWSTGDIQTLREMATTDVDDPCLAAIGDAGFARKLGMQDVQARIGKAWLDAARKALADNAQSLALLPMRDLFSGNGYIAALRREGYRVEAPAP